MQGGRHSFRTLIAARPVFFFSSIPFVRTLLLDCEGFRVWEGQSPRLVSSFLCPKVKPARSGTTENPPDQGSAPRTHPHCGPVALCCNMKLLGCIAPRGRCLGPRCRGAACLPGQHCGSGTAALAQRGQPPGEPPEASCQPCQPSSAALHHRSRDPPGRGGSVRAAGAQGTATTSCVFQHWRLERLCRAWRRRRQSRARLIPHKLWCWAPPALPSPPPPAQPGGDVQRNPLTGGKTEGHGGLAASGEALVATVGTWRMPGHRWVLFVPFHLAGKAGQEPGNVGGWVGSWGGKGKGAACVESRVGVSMTHGSMWEELSLPGETSCAGLPRGSRHLPASKHPPGEVPLTETIHGTRNSSPTPARGSPGGSAGPSSSDTFTALCSVPSRHIVN